MATLLALFLVFVKRHGAAYDLEMAILSEGAAATISFQFLIIVRSVSWG